MNQIQLVASALLTENYLRHRITGDRLSVDYSPEEDVDEEQLSERCLDAGFTYVGHWALGCVVIDGSMQDLSNLAKAITELDDREQDELDWISAVDCAEIQTMRLEEAGWFSDLPEHDRLYNLVIDHLTEMHYNNKSFLTL